MASVVDTVGAPITSFPKLLWRSYLDHLWYYESDSWVAKMANSARVLAILFALPIIILALLDISSYGIARTLGVIDDVKASTSDVASIHAAQAIQEQHGNEAINTSQPNSLPGDTDGDPSPIRSDEELYSVLQATAVPDISADDSSASEEHPVDHTSHNLTFKSARTTSTRERVQDSDGILYQRQATKAESDL